MNRSHFLGKPTKPIDVKPKELSQILGEMKSIGFQGRKLGECFDVWTKMLKEKNIVIWMTLSGAMSAGGMRRIISYLMERRMIDGLISTGANLYHDMYEVLYKPHYMGTHMANDVQLHKHKVDRIYDVYADEKEFVDLDGFIEKKFCPTLERGYPYSSREILSKLGEFCYSKAKEKKSIILSAYKHGVPIFAPAFGDSSLGFSMMFANRHSNDEKKIQVDYLKDVHESSLITQRAKKTSLAIIGGGVPKNFAQQTAVVAGYESSHQKALSYAFQLCPDPPQWGGLSGATLEEAQSWGKYAYDAKMVNCYIDATVGLPILAHAMAEHYPKGKLKRNVPVFDFSKDDLKIKYEKRSL